jgi:adenylate cyclase
MEKNLIRHYRLANELSELFDLESSIDNVLAVSMYKLNQLMDSERSSIFLFDPLKQQLTSFSSQDLEKKEIRIPKSAGVSGWVFDHRMPAIVNDTDSDSRFYSGVDDMTGFRTRNLICTPLIDYKERCSGTLQSLNKKSGDFTTDDLELLDLTARLVAVAISNSRRYDEILTTNRARKKLINKIVSNIGNQPDK